MNSKKGIVHTISLISLIGIAVVSMALVLVLSVFNGFTSVAEKMLEKENPPLLISASKGKTFNEDISKKLSNIQGIKAVIPVVKQTVMISVGESQKIVQMIGTDSTYFLYNPLDTCIVNGKQSFNNFEDEECFMGLNLAMDMGLGKGAEKMNIFVKFTVPQKNDDAIVPEDMLQTKSLVYSACYRSMNADLDAEYVFVPLSSAREILSYNDKAVNNFYVVPANLRHTNKLQKQIQEVLGEDYSVKNILQQQAVYFRIAKSEKLAVYIILSLIIFIAMVNIISSLIILYIQKQDMNFIFRAIGMTRRDVRRVYFYYGMLLNILGCFIGVALGVVFCLLQQCFGIIKLPESSFVVEAFPVRIFFWDIIRVVLIVLIIGALSIKMVSSRIKIN